MDAKKVYHVIYLSTGAIISRLYPLPGFCGRKNADGTIARDGTLLYSGPYSSCAAYLREHINALRGQK